MASLFSVGRELGVGLAAFGEEGGGCWWGRYFKESLAVTIFLTLLSAGDVVTFGRLRY